MSAESALLATTDIFTANLGIVYFIYGLSFFSLGLILGLEAISPIRLPNLNHLWVLSAFGLVHGLREWLSMANVISPSSVAAFGPTWRIVEVAVLFLSFALLLEFGIATLGLVQKLPLWLDLIPALLILLCGLYVVNRAPDLGGLGDPRWMEFSEAIARYFIGLPGSLVTAFALWTAGRSLRGSRTPKIERSFTGAAISLVFYAVLAGLIVAPAPFFPASVLNTAWFQSTFGVPVQVLRALCAIAITAFLIQGYFIEATRYANTMNELLFSLNASSRAIVSKLDLAETLESIVQAARDLLSADTSFLSLVTEDGNNLRVVASSGVRTEALKQLELRRDQGMAGMAITTGRPVIVDDYFRATEISGRALEVLRNEGIISGIAAPLLSDGKVLGILYVFNRRPTKFDDTDASILTALASLAAVAIEHARLYKAEQERVKRLQELDQLKNEFISITSHEFRTPLTTIKGWADLMRSKSFAALEEEQLKTALDTISKEATRLANLVESVLNVSRIETGALPFNPHCLRLLDCIEEVVQQMEVQARSRGINIQVKVDQSIEVNADPTLLKQILVNLVGNAIKYTQDNTTITVAARTDDGKAIVSVHDEGLGIPEERIPLLFGRFVRLPHPGAIERPGAGLGLYITKRLVEMHGGTIWVESRQGEGATFYFTLPLHCR